jgi:hypothetical protein
LRGGGTHGDTIRALRFLEREGLIQATERGIRATMAGLVIAVASARAVQKKKAPVVSLKVDRSRRAA